jgi:hypothetical protein
MLLFCNTGGNDGGSRRITKVIFGLFYTEFFNRFNAQKQSTVAPAAVSVPPPKRRAAVRAVCTIGRVTHSGRAGDGQAAMIIASALAGMVTHADPVRAYVVVKTVPGNCGKRGQYNNSYLAHDAPSRGCRDRSCQIESADLRLARPRFQECVLRVKLRRSRPRQRNPRCRHRDPAPRRSNHGASCRASRFRWVLICPCGIRAIVTDYPTMCGGSA